MESIGSPSVSRTSSQISPLLLIPLPPDGPTRLPKIKHTSPLPVITTYQPLIKPPFQNYNKAQKQKLKTFVDIKVSVAEKNAKQSDFEGVIPIIKMLVIYSE
jgi:hypothetical protein